MSRIISRTEKHQKTVNKVYKFYRSYHECVNLEGTFNTDQEEKANARKQSKQYENYYEAYRSLPKGERVNFNTKHKKIHGYT